MTCMITRQTAYIQAGQTSLSVIPAEAGIQGDFQQTGEFAWAPAFAGATM